MFLPNNSFNPLFENLYLFACNTFFVFDNSNVLFLGICLVSLAYKASDLVKKSSSNFKAAFKIKSPASLLPKLLPVAVKSSIALFNCSKDCE